MKLVHALIGKSIAESLLVGTLAIAFIINALPPVFRGWGEVTQDSIAGWAVNTASPYSRVRVQLFVDGNFIATGVANEYRPDVRTAHWAKDDWHGYKFPLPRLSEGIHVARVYALHSSGGRVRQTLQQLGGPMLFRLDANGKLRKYEVGEPIPEIK